MDLERKTTKCRCCGKDVKQKYNPQGGGAEKIYCSSKCRTKQWARDNTCKNLKLKLEKRFVKHDWLRDTPELKILHYAKQRSKKRGIEISIELDDIKIPHFCPLLGIILEHGSGKCQQSSPSLDRIDSKRGYSKDNVWIISHKANTIKSDCSISELKLLVERLEQKLIEQKIHEDRKDNED